MISKLNLLNVSRKILSVLPGTYHDIVNLKKAILTLKMELAHDYSHCDVFDIIWKSYGEKPSYDNLMND